MTFKERAEILTQRRVPVIPLLPKTKIASIKDWQNQATTSLEQVEKWNADHENYNTAGVAKAELGGSWFLDLDNEEILSQIKRETGFDFKNRLGVSARAGRGYFIFRQSASSIAAGNMDGNDTNGKEAWSARINDRYQVGPGSVHPEGGVYTIVFDGEISEAPEELVKWLVEHQTKKTRKTATANDTPIPDGSRNTTLTSIAGRYRDLGESADDIYERLSTINQERCVPPLPDDQIRKIANSVGGYEDGITRRMKEVVLINGVPAGSTSPAPQAEVIPLPEPVAAMTEEEQQVENEKEYPVIPLTGQIGPEWDESIFYGPAGQVIKKASEYNESHPVGMLLDLLVSIGSIIGRGPYFNVNSTRHYTNEFLCRVGQSSRSRKGTGRDAVDEFLRLIDPEWCQRRIFSGFGSPEAVIHNLRDASQEQRLNKKKNQFDTIVKPGVDDKRLCIREGEVASIFLLASKSESRADVVLRDGWDGKPLLNIVKGQSTDGINNSARCEEPHLSISGDTTVSELKRKMPAGADENGFGNRFLYCYVYRTKLCPNGGPGLNWTQEALYFREILAYSNMVGLVSMTKAARQWWNNHYQELEEVPPGMAGSMTSRGPAHVKRLAMIYALIDKSDEIKLEHFHAAFRLWEYCLESAIYIFGGTPKHHHKLADWIRQNGPVSITEIREKCYHRNRPVRVIQAEIDELIRQNAVSTDADKYKAA